MEVRVHKTLMTRIERIGADLLGFYPLAGSALACGVRRGLILLANSPLAPKPVISCCHCKNKPMPHTFWSLINVT
jgi:hypothetical protein